jgi:hypothetical protein
MFSTFDQAWWFLGCFLVVGSLGISAGFWRSFGCAQDDIFCLG